MYEAVLKLVVLVDAHIWIRQGLRVVGVAFLSVRLVGLGQHYNDCGRLVLLPDHAPDVRPAVCFGSLCCNVLELRRRLCRLEHYGRGIDVVEMAVWYLKVDSVGLVWVNVDVAITVGIILAEAPRPLGSLFRSAGLGAVPQALDLGHLQAIPFGVNVLGRRQEGGIRDSIVAMCMACGWGACDGRVDDETAGACRGRVGGGRVEGRGGD